MIALGQILRCAGGNRRLQGGAHGDVLVLAGQVQHLQASGQGVQGLAEDLVEVLGSQRAARHQERGHVGVESQRLGAVDAGTMSPLSGGALRRQVGDGRAQWQPGHLGTPLGGLEAGRCEGQRHRLGPGRPQAVGQAGAGVLLVDDDRHAGLPGGQVGGGGDVSAEADDDVGLHGLDGLGGCADRFSQPVRQTQQVPAGASRQGDPGNQGQLEAGLGNQAVLQPLGGPQDEDLRAGVTSQRRVLQGRGRGQQRVDVAGGASTGQQHPQGPGALLPARLHLAGRACGLTCLGHGSSLGQ